MVLVKIYSVYRNVIAICDSDLIGRKLEDSDGKKALDLTGNFFKGEELDDERVIEIMKDGYIEDATFNIVGKKSCSLAKRIGLIREGGIIYVEDVPVALVLI